MPEAMKFIAKPAAEVWAALTTSENWQAWHGSTPTATPGWEPGAMLVWPGGDRSTIEECVEGKVLTFAGMFLGTTLELVPQGNTTEVHYSFEPRGGAAFSDGGAAQLAKVEQQLERLKGLIEGSPS